MTWTISHGTPGGRFDGYHSRSYSQVADWRDAVLGLGIHLSDRDVVALEPLLKRRSGDPFSVRPRQAAAIAGALRQHSHRMPPAQREMTETLAAAAQRAADAGEKWRWS